MCCVHLWCGEEASGSGNPSLSGRLPLTELIDEMMVMIKKIIMLTGYWKHCDRSCLIDLDCYWDIQYTVKKTTLYDKTLKITEGKKAAYPIEVQGVCPHQPKPVKKDVMSISCAQYVAINLEEYSICTSQFILWSQVDSFQNYFTAQCATINLGKFFTCKRCRARV